MNRGPHCGDRCLAARGGEEPGGEARVLRFDGRSRGLVTPSRKPRSRSTSNGTRPGSSPAATRFMEADHAALRPGGLAAIAPVHRPRAFARLPSSGPRGRRRRSRRGAVRHRRHVPRRRAVRPQRHPGRLGDAPALQRQPRRQAVRDPVVRRLWRCCDRARLHRAFVHGDRGGGGADRRGRRRAAADRRRPRLHPAPPPGDPVARAGGRDRLRLPHRRLGQLLRREVQPRDVDAARDRGGPGRRRPFDRGRAARRVYEQGDWTSSGPSSGSRT